MPQIDCAGCGQSIDWRSKDGTCKECRRKPCADCGKKLSPDNKSGLCSPCNLARHNADPAFNAKRLAALDHKMRTDPVYRARQIANGRRLGTEAAKDPELRKRRVEWGKKVYREVLNRPDVRAKNLASVKGSGCKQSATKLAWCPPEYRRQYLDLLYKGKLLRDEARKLILDQIASDKRKADANLSPFERQQRALERGAKLVANDHGPSLDNPANYGEERWSYGR